MVFTFIPVFASSFILVISFILKKKKNEVMKSPFYEEEN